MHFSQITLRNWKSFASATFRFPANSESKNIILIGAPNGYGKTSLFEAIVLGLYGREGLSHIARAPISFENETRHDNKSYQNFMEKALFKGSFESGENSCSVKIEFETDNNEPLEIRRIWYFSENGVFRQQDEHIEIFEGKTRKLVGPKGLKKSDRIDWHREYIANNIIPFDLSKFFMFDGEQVSDLAEREMSGQVKHGIEGLLGIPILKHLAKDLRDYSEIRRKNSKSVSDETMEKLQTEYNSKNLELETKVKNLKEVELKLERFAYERDKLMNEVSSFGSGTQESLQEKFERIKDFQKSIDQSESQLEEMLLKDIALALTGSVLQEKVIKQMDAENAREKWDNAKNQGDSKLDKFLDILQEKFDEINPNLTENQRKGVTNGVRGSWQILWNPPPPNCAEKIIHAYLKDSDRSNVIENLQNLSDLGRTNILDIIDRIDSDSTDLLRLQEDVKRTESIAPQIEEKLDKLNTINSEIQELSRKSGELNREISGLEGQVNNIKAELNQMSGYLEQAKPATRRASRAIKVASIIDEIVSQAVPSQIQKIAEKMTSAHNSMSHKKDMIRRIEISDDCDVRLLGSENTDLRKFDISAGEKQIFTQSLLSAVTSVSQRSFPMVIDTPLGRLDVDHRKGLLNHLTTRKGQVLLLSTNTEVVGEYLQEIAPHVQKMYTLKFKQVGEFGRSTVQEGYFEEGK